MSNSISLRIVAVFAAVALAIAWPTLTFAIELDFLVDTDPKLTIPPPVLNFAPAQKMLWMEALNRPEIDMQRMAAETIARAHQLEGIDFSEAVPVLENILLAAGSHSTARFAAARSLIVLDSRSSSEKLLTAARSYGADLRHLIEPALAQWKYTPAASVWIQRLADTTTRRRDLVLAVQCLGLCEDRQALSQLLSLVDRRSADPDLRYEAAKAAGRIQVTGLELKAEELIQGKGEVPVIDRLCAIELLSRHDTEPAQQTMLSLARDPEPLVAAQAMRRLNSINSERNLPMIAEVLQSADPRLRGEATTAILEHPTAERIQQLSRLLADPDPQIRARVTEGLSTLYERQAELKETIENCVREILDQASWQGQEQGAIVAGAINLKSAATRLVELLGSARNEVRIAAAWSLRKIAVPETIPALIETARQVTAKRKDESLPGMDEQVAHLFEALGVMQASEALPLLREYIPKQPFMGQRSRSAAIWAIGRLKHDDLGSDLEDALSDRILDFEDKPAEIPLVKQMSAISLARMKSVKQAAMMREMAVNMSLPVELGVSLRWAVKELTGEELPPPTPLTIPAVDWFLAPVQ